MPAADHATLAAENARLRSAMADMDQRIDGLIEYYSYCETPPVGMPSAAEFSQLQSELVASEQRVKGLTQELAQSKQEIALLRAKITPSSAAVPPKAPEAHSTKSSGGEWSFASWLMTMQLVALVFFQVALLRR